MAASTINAPYTHEVDWTAVRAALNAPTTPRNAGRSVSSAAESTPSSVGTSVVNVVSSHPRLVKSWISASSLSIYLDAKDTRQISSMLWTGWVPVSVLFDRMSADPKQTFNELVQKGLLTGHKFSEYNCKVTCLWIAQLDIGDSRLDCRSFKGKHRSKGGAGAEAIKALMVALVKQHISFEEDDCL